VTFQKNPLAGGFFLGIFKRFFLGGFLNANPECLHYLRLSDRELSANFSTFSEISPLPF
jgi:hypothetical protein